MKMNELVREKETASVVRVISPQSIREVDFKSATLNQRSSKIGQENTL